ncbi:peptide hydrolase [Trypanosoma cruzi]|nr:peptide hydrolase [Trypanosoma cruzi]
MRHNRHCGIRCFCVRGRTRSAESGTLGSVVITIRNRKPCIGAPPIAMKPAVGSRSIPSARVHKTKLSEASRTRESIRRQQQMHALRRAAKNPETPSFHTRGPEQRRRMQINAVPLLLNRGIFQAGGAGRQGHRARELCSPRTAPRPSVVDLPSAAREIGLGRGY